MAVTCPHPGHNEDGRPARTKSLQHSRVAKYDHVELLVKLWLTRCMEPPNSKDHHQKIWNDMWKDYKNGILVFPSDLKAKGAQVAEELTALAQQ